MKKRQLTENDLRDLWLKKYHNTTSQEVALKHPELAQTPEWFKLYPCTQEQSDAWVIEAKKALKKDGYPKWSIERGWGLLFVNNSPYVPKEL